jgi:hypothetical protein
VIKGNLDRLHLGDLLQWFQMGGLSGRLTLTERQRDRHLDFLDGQIVFVSSTVPEERLASWLATEGLLPVSVLRRLLSISLLRRTLFTGLLMEQGGFSSDHLRTSLTRLAETITSRILISRDVRFVLDPSYPVRNLLGLTLHVEPNLLMMEAARRNDESPAPSQPAGEFDLPLTGDNFDAFFWKLIKEGISDEERVDGEEVAHLQGLIRSIVATLAEWLTSGPGLVPIPPIQTARIDSVALKNGRVEQLGLPHVIWNQMVLACAIRSPHLQHPETLQDLAQQTADLDLLAELLQSERWRRPQAGRIDDLTGRTVIDWSRAAAAAAPHMDVSADAVGLAVHLVVVPTDLVLWVLSTLPVHHRRLRTILLRELPRRLGLGLAQMADFPHPIRQLFERDSLTRLGTCLHLARGVLPTAQVWPLTVPVDESLLLNLAAPGNLTQAATAARNAIAPVGDSKAIAG